jgi:hypothetical protein
MPKVISGVREPETATEIFLGYRYSSTVQIP